MTERVFRIFLSSTFGDFQIEREALRSRVWPLLEGHCQQHGASFEVVDLRWGISETDDLQHKTLSLCLSEVKRCKALSPKPNFIMLVGDRYGWRPVPDQIGEADFRCLLGTAVDPALLRKWYRLDKNAQPPVFVLKPKNDAWQSESAALCRILREAVDLAGFDDRQRRPYFLSATHQEIIHGALDDEAAKDHVFAYCRSISGLSGAAFRPESSGQFTDYVDGLYDEEAARLRKELLTQIGSRLPPEHRFSYQAEWLDEPAAPISTEHVEALCADVHRSLLRLIDAELAGAAPDPLQIELACHRQFSADRLVRPLVGRDDEINLLRHEVARRMQAEHPIGPCLIHGPGGVGKSALMAALGARLRNEYRSAVLIERFVGVSPRSGHLDFFLRDVIQEIGMAYAEVFPLHTLATKDLIQLLPDCFSLASAEQPLILLIDGLDQWAGIDAEACISWLPHGLPRHVIIVLSALDHGGGAAICEQAIRHFPACTPHFLAPLGVEHGRAILGQLLAAQGRTLSRQQTQRILGAFEKNGCPLFLVIAATIARHWLSSSKTPKSFPHDWQGLVKAFLRDLQKRHFTQLAGRTLDFLGAGRFGLSGREIRDLLWDDPAVKREFLRYKNKDQPDVDSLPEFVWSRLYFDLAPLLSRQLLDGSLLYRFFHRELLEQTKRLSRPAKIVETHRAIARYFSRQAAYLEDDVAAGGEVGKLLPISQLTPHARKLSEEVWQWSKAGDFAKASQCLTDYHFVSAKCQSAKLEDLIEDYGRLDALYAGEGLCAWRDFIVGNAHVLRRQSKTWPAEKILLQIACEQAVQSPVNQSVERWLEGGRCDWFWLRSAPSSRANPNRVFSTVLEGSEGHVNGVMVLPGRKIVSWWNAPWGKGDKSIHVWDTATGKLLSTLVGHRDYVTDVIPIGDQRWVSWSSYPGGSDFSLYLWRSDTDVLVSTLVEHQSEIRGVMSLADSAFLSWSTDCLAIWDALTGRKIAVYTPESGLFSGVGLLASGEIVCWYPEGIDTLHLSLAGKHSGLRSVGRFFLPVALVPAAKDSVVDLLTLPDDRLLIRTRKSRLFVWSPQLDEVWSITHDHRRDMQGVLLTSSGHILSWSFDQARVWHSETLVCMSVLSDGQFAGSFQSLAGHRVMAYGGDHVLRVWNCETGAVDHAISFPGEKPFSYRLVDHELLITWSEDSQIRLWSLQNGALIRSIEAKQTTISNIQVLKNGNLLIQPRAIRSWDGQLSASSRSLHLLDGASGRTICSLVGHTEAINGVDQLEDGRFLSWSGDGTLRIWELAGNGLSRDAVQIYVGAERVCHDHIAGWCEDGGLHLYSANGKNDHACLIGHTDQIRGVLSLSPKRFVTWGDDGLICVWTTCQQRPIKSFSVDLGIRNQAKRLDNGMVVFYGFGDEIFLLENAEQPVLSRLAIDSDDGEVLEIGGDGEIFAWSADFDTDDYRVSRIDPRDGKIITQYVGHAAIVNDVIPYKEMNVVISWSLDETVRVWDYQTGASILPVHEHCGEVDGVMLLGDGRLVSWSNTSIMVSAIDIQAPVQLLEGHCSSVRSVCQLGERVLLSCSDSECIRWAGSEPVWKSDYPGPGTVSVRQFAWCHDVLACGSRMLLFPAHHFHVDAGEARWMDSSGSIPRVLGTGEKSVFPILSSDGRLMFAQLMFGNQAVC